MMLYTELTNKAIDIASLFVDSVSTRGLACREEM